MKLSKKVIEALDNMNSRMRLALALGKSESSIRRYLEDNDIILTTKKAIEVILIETGLSEDEIFEKEETAKA